MFHILSIFGFRIHDVQIVSNLNVRSRFVRFSSVLRSYFGVLECDIDFSAMDIFSYYTVKLRK
ncbi:hypothetical protein BUQ74_07310 [Leptospira weilii serovar Heyan]|uniref:Uncharacterized protein n=1 Tax=Leptospira weilii str. UI 13098 TaxID=1088542 RepID=M6QAQ4_9LEPT|nr:hypothetical protein LEP1GSC108_1212 [Leptospira weilii str. UI 13098]OMI17968.1 hypothetical protein BUQ74_07310 [Leptospira weilii serovar Heyan]